jgi:hypothetical protein
MRKKSYRNKERNILMTTGFMVTENLVGKHNIEDEFKNTFLKCGTDIDYWSPIYVDARISSSDINRSLSYLIASGSTHLSLGGKIHAVGLCYDAPIINGTVIVDPFGSREISYTFDFKAQGKWMRYTGRKHNIRWWNLPTSISTCYGTITCGDRLVSTSVLYLKVRHLRKLFSSFSVTH